MDATVLLIHPSRPGLELGISPSPMAMAVAKPLNAQRTSLEQRLDLIRISNSKSASNSNFGAAGSGHVR